MSCFIGEIHLVLRESEVVLLSEFCRQLQEDERLRKGPKILCLFNSGQLGLRGCRGGDNRTQCEHRGREPWSEEAEGGQGSRENTRLETILSK